MASIETEQPAMASQSLEEMQDRLDELWTKHLTLLDQYDQAQKQLQKHLSSGFFSLAQASFKSSARMRYGQDYYDDRMQATRRCRIAMTERNQARFSVRGEKKNGAVESAAQSGEKKAEGDEQTHDEQQRDAEKDGKDDDETEQLPTPPATPSCEPHDPTALDNDSTLPANEEKNQPKKQPADPLHWYGILVPPQLRQSQTSFVAAVEGPIGAAVTAAQSLRKLDVEIRRLRKDIKKREKKEKETASKKVDGA